MGTIIGRNMKLEVALTFGSPLAPTAVTKAAPPVVTLSTHGQTDGVVGYWSVSAGMVELDQQAILVDNAATNSWEMPGLDSTNYSTYTAGSFVPAATWGTVSEAKQYDVNGGAADPLPDDRLIDSKHRNIAGLLASQDVTITIAQQEISGAALAFIELAALRGASCLFKVTKGSQVLRVFWGVPSLAGESVAAGQLGSGSFGVTCPAFVIKPNV